MIIEEEKGDTRSWHIHTRYGNHVESMFSITLHPSTMNLFSDLPKADMPLPDVLVKTVDLAVGLAVAVAVESEMMMYHPVEQRGALLQEPLSPGVAFLLPERSRLYPLTLTTR
jgi:hypothetical protein